MITEIATIDIQPGSEEDFEQAWLQADPLIACAPGIISHELLRGVETSSRYTLIVRWESVSAHMDGFRESDNYQQFRTLVSPFYAGVHMEHFRERA